MLPFKGHAWNAKLKRLQKHIKDEEEGLAERMKEHDYSECYCIALMNPPWGGYSDEEQILHEVKQRKKGASQRKHQITGTSSYTYLSKDQAAVLGDAAVQTTKSVFILPPPKLELTYRSLQPKLFRKTSTAQLGHAKISKVAHAPAPSVVAAIYKISTNVFQINAPPGSSQRDSLQHRQQSRPARARHSLGGFQTLHHSDWPCAL